MVSVVPYKAFLVLLEAIGFVLNVLVLFLLSKLRLKGTDMWLGVAMAVCDIVLSGFKVMEFIIYLIVGPDSFLREMSFVTPLCAVLLFALLGSVAAVGYLALIRWLVICHKYQVNEMRHWWWIYLTHIIVLFVLIITCAANGGFVETPSKYSYPDFQAQNTLALLTRLATLITVLACFLKFNVAYVLICKQYIQQLDSRIGYQTRAEKHVLQIEKTKVLVKISLMLLLYNITIVPFFVVDFIELALGAQRSWIASVISGQAVVSISFVNPAMLVTMHCETWREVKKLFAKSRKAKHYPIIEGANSSVELAAYQTKNI